MKINSVRAIGSLGGDPQRPKADQQVHTESQSSIIFMMSGVYSHNNRNILPADLTLSLSIS